MSFPRGTLFAIAAAIVAAVAVVAAVTVVAAVAHVAAVSPVAAREAPHNARTPYPSVRTSRPAYAHLYLLQHFRDQR